MAHIRHYDFEGLDFRTFAGVYIIKPGPRKIRRSPRIKIRGLNLWASLELL
jgi:hypothetical protein